MTPSKNKTTVDKDPKSKNIYQRVNEVMKEDASSYLQKDSNVMDRYKAISHDKVIATLRPLLVKHGIVLEASQRPMEVSFHIVPVAKPIHLFMAVYTVSLVNMDNPEDRISVDVEAHATCTDDKAPGKTYSYAVKMALLKVFCIETGESDESKNAPAPALDITLITQEQATTLKGKADKLGKTAQVLKALDVQLFEQIPTDKYEWTLSHLNKQLEAKEAAKAEPAPQ